MSPAPQPELGLALQEAAELIATSDPTAVFQIRVGLTALDLIRDRTSPYATPLQDAIADVAVLDAYAARDVLNHLLTHAHLSSEHRQKLKTVVTAARLGTGNLPHDHMGRPSLRLWTKPNRPSAASCDCSQTGPPSAPLHGTSHRIGRQSTPFHHRKRGSHGIE